MKRDIAETGLPEFWRSLRAEVAAQGQVLNEAVFEQIRKVFLAHYSSGAISPGALTREFEREEFMLVMDEQGRASGTEKQMLAAYLETAATQPDFQAWLQVLRAEEPAGSVLLAARWLCHLAGLRHGTVEIFIDPPHLEGHTLVQIRGLDKFEAPGAFDIPCAGHMSGVDSVEESLRKELAEELNLSVEDDLSDLRLVKRYNSYTGGGTDGSINNEYRVLYRARLRAASAGRIRFTDGEVAGLAVFSVSELKEMIRRYPERIASGLGDAIPYYS